jgi:hypothetical protein
MNRLTVQFQPCTPTPSGGYNMFYRIKGSSDAFRNGGNFTASPIVVDVTTDADGTLYEGYIQSNCGAGNLGEHITFSNPDTPTVHTRNLCLNDTSHCGCDTSAVPIYFLGNAGTDPLTDGTIIYYDAGLTNKVLDHPYLYGQSFYYSINQTTGAVTLMGGC